MRSTNQESSLLIHVRRSNGNGGAAIPRMTVSVPVDDPAINAVMVLIALTGWFSMVVTGAEFIIEASGIEQWITVAEEQNRTPFLVEGLSKRNSSVIFDAWINSLACRQKKTAGRESGTKCY